MPKEYEFTINGQLFYVEHYNYNGGWAWWTADAEMDGWKDTPWEAQQDAIDYVHKKNNDEIQKADNELWTDYKPLPESMNPDRE